MFYLILNYADYPERPDVLFKGNTPMKERKSLDGTKFVVWCDGTYPESMDWISEADKANVLTQEQIIAEMKKVEWQEEEGAEND